jgi:hypothetical protein
MNRRLGGPQKFSVHFGEKNNIASAGIRSQDLQSLAQSHFMMLKCSDAGLKDQLDNSQLIQVHGKSSVVLIP